ncbi:peptidase M24, structural domain-containing protein [Gilbertella persicaria]|uniref:peptidase M24, structural domain-containing protein n=1 Tax=Gilbertella persicaria TaxID=101096 RepID=UPI002220EA78|nr:peptidase M24, structural domain-containing protein [Gilbertella persicaria]KAI8075936.1 peptidase M24, structural domain-containing protein [Gilbertella persicaria]
MATKPTCAAIECSNEARLQCPTCIKLGKDEGSFFCSQDCFKKSWGTHKAIHGNTKSPYDPFKTFKYSGPLRAVYPLSSRRIVPEHIPRPDYAETGLSKSEYMARSSDIKVLTPEEIEGVKKACAITKEVLEITAKAIRVGITTDELDRIAHEATIERNAYPSPLNYNYFPKSCCTSLNEVICHGIPDQRALIDGDIINIDISCYYNGFHGDTNATYLVGNVDETGQKLVNVTRECLEKSIAAVKPGMRYRDFGKIIEDHATKNGFSVVRAFVGHGINQLFHCAPNVPHYANNKAIGVCKPGHVFTIEPMICEGVHQELLWPDGWTATTKDGKRSAQFEHTLLVTETGVEILT